MLDTVDIKILRQLCRDARTPNAQLAEMVHLTPTPCLRRVRKLESNGVVRAYRAELDHLAMGFRVSALAFVKLSRYSESNASIFEQAVRSIPAVVGCSVIAGQFDYILRIVARDLPDYERILKEDLAGIETIEKVESTIILKKIDCSDRLPF